MNTSTADAQTRHMPVINETASDFKAETTQGTIRFRDWIGDSWAVLSSHPKEFTPVCTTELGAIAALQPELAKKNTKIVALSVDPVSHRERWVTDIEDTQGCRVNYPIIGDPRLEVAKLYGMLPAESWDSSEGRTAANSAALRTVFMIVAGKVLKPYLRIVPQPK